MPDLSQPSTLIPMNERKAQAKGFDLPRAYHALINGFVQVHTARKLNDVKRCSDEQGEQQ